MNRRLQALNSAADSRALPIQAYGIKVGGLSKWLLEFGGNQLVAGMVIAALSLAGATLNNAVAWSCLPYTVFVLQGILQGRPAKHGASAAGQYLILATNTLMYTLHPKHPTPSTPHSETRPCTRMHTLWTGATYADTALTVFNAWMWLNAVTQVHHTPHTPKLKPRTLNPKCKTIEPPSFFHNV